MPNIEQVLLVRRKITRKKIAGNLSTAAHAVIEISTVLAIFGKGLHFVAGEMYEEPRKRLRIR